MQIRFIDVVGELAQSEPRYLTVTYLQSPDNINNFSSTRLWRLCITKHVGGKQKAYSERTCERSQRVWGQSEQINKPVCSIR